MGYIFISYSHKDKDYVHKLYQNLFEHSLDAWIDDRLDYGSRWPREIEKRLKECCVFILIMSPNSYESEWVQNELDLARRLEKPIFPLLLDGEDTWWHVRTIQYLDVRNGALPTAKFFVSLANIISQSNESKKQGVSINIAGNVQGNIVVGNDNKVQATISKPNEVENTHTKKDKQEEANREAEEKKSREKAEADKKAREKVEADRLSREKARREVEDLARKATEEKARKEKEEKARREVEDLARKATEEKARKEKEEKVRREVEELARKATGYRWATPVKNYILCFVLGETGIAIYSFWQNPMSGLSVTMLVVVSVFGVTAVSAMIFPYVKKVSYIWESSPYKTWKVLGIPVVTIGGIVNLIYLAILSYFYVFMPGFESYTLSTLLFYAAIWGLGIIWYFYWKAKNEKDGLDSGMIYGQLPPD